MEEKKKDKIHWRVVGMLFLILIILPAGSWYYLSEGYSYRKDLLSDLQIEYGDVKPYSLRTADGRPFDLSDIEHRTTVARFVSVDGKSNEFGEQMMDRLHEQFDDKNEILFLTHYVGGLPADLPKDTAQYLSLTGSAAEIERIAREHYRIPFDTGETITENARFVLTDSLQIRGYYDVNDAMQAGRLVEHITIVMPRTIKADIYLDRDKEM